MQINKLTITPILRGYRGFTTQNPKSEVARTLIIERLATQGYTGTKIPNSVKKLPKALRSWINPKTHVVQIRKFV